MTSAPPIASPHVAVVGGGLAGLAAAVALTSAGCRVELFEARRALGGRAASFRDPTTGEVVDQCQHVSMGCCTNLADFCRRTGIAELFGRDPVVNFIGPDSRHYRLRASRWLPAPLHLAPSFWRLKYLAPCDRVSIARAMWKLMRYRAADHDGQPTVGQWLASAGQSDSAVELFWGVILTSALGEEPHRASVAAARKVLVDGFLAARDAYVLEVPKVPLATLYDERLMSWCASYGVDVRLQAPVRRIAGCEQIEITRADGTQSRADFVVAAVPWSRLADILAPEIAERLTWLDRVSRIEPAPITSVHLWFDRPIMPLEHAALVGRLGQWIFNRGWRDEVDRAGGHYYQVVISASHALAGRDREAVAIEVRNELASIWPEARRATLLRSRVVTEHGAVFSPRPGLDAVRPSQTTPWPGLVVAGDWTATHWPATMEGAVRSGYLAAESVMESAGRAQKFLVPDLPRGFLARLLIA
jgi:squalene-associated FAD-dependent desaturase